ncbi:MAG: hypothetical protein K2X03_16600 [Bryobacteraceae bacterium]|nr:hypothetical protein [Bryobacteraceae bacterium]
MLTIQVQVLFDQGAHNGRGLGATERARFWRMQEQARREFGVSGLRFDVRVTEGAYLRTQTYSEIPSQFLVRGRLHLFVTETLRLDVDSQRTGGSSSGGPAYKIFLGLRQAVDTTLSHEYAHHFTRDTARRPTLSGNFWADSRNDYWLWRQRHGVAIPEFRACAGLPWARTGTSSI